jgi:hypothetical protein
LAGLFARAGVFLGRGLVFEELSDEFGADSSFEEGKDLDHPMEPTSEGGDHFAHPDLV